MTVVGNALPHIFKLIGYQAGSRIFAILSVPFDIHTPIRSKYTIMTFPFVQQDYAASKTGLHELPHHATAWNISSVKNTHSYIR